MHIIQITRLKNKQINLFLLNNNIIFNKINMI